MEPPRRRRAPDRLTSLPEPLIEGILTRVGFRDAVRTSALSRAWRRRWESLPALSLSLLDGLISTRPTTVDSVLIRFAGSIRVFSIRIDADSLFRWRLDDWLIALSRRGVRSMDLRLPCGFNINSSIYSFSNLVTLELHGGYVPSTPVGFAGFPALQELKLVDVQVSVKEALEAIIGRSPRLAVLELCEVHNPSDEPCMIAAPNLRSLTIVSVADYYAWEFGELPCLDNATIDFDTYVNGDDFGVFIAGVAHARKLTLSTFYYQPIINNQEQETEANAEFQNTQWTDGMCASLHVVKINDISCFLNEMCFIELVLSKATALRKMSISLGDECSMSEENALSKLYTYRRASPSAQVFFKGNNSSSDGEELTTSAPCGARRTLFRNKSIEKFHRFKPWEERSSSYSSSVKGGKESRIAYIISISNHMQFGMTKNKSWGCVDARYFNLLAPHFSGCKSGKNTLRQGHRGATGNSRGSGQDPHPEWSHQAKTGKAPNAPSRCIVIWRRLPNGSSSINFPPKQTTITYLLGKIPEQEDLHFAPRSQEAKRDNAALSPPHVGICRTPSGTLDLWFLQDKLAACVYINSLSFHVQKELLAISQRQTHLENREES
ncbi:F-box/FBD/LRR-repeat protein At1g13570-like isoform X3 [Panicum virgatum]|uniref:F-box/FBD/LRR-repeat protein At1g13570-like isoform X3 n=1 Tax=Panicum virgatum TaxID=38727 RepID=UPI0019D66BF2|nr:F-box/FBD/LRR-repeat protein At1g13570-like isoform X3 [Panicum virgatum]